MQIICVPRYFYYVKHTIKNYGNQRTRDIITGQRENVYEKKYHKKKRHKNHFNEKNL